MLTSFGSNKGLHPKEKYLFRSNSRIPPSIWNLPFFNSWYICQKDQRRVMYPFLGVLRTKLCDVMWSSYILLIRCYAGTQSRKQLYIIHCLNYKTIILGHSKNETMWCEALTFCWYAATQSRKQLNIFHCLNYKQLFLVIQRTKLCDVKLLHFVDTLLHWYADKINLTLTAYHCITKILMFPEWLCINVSAQKRLYEIGEGILDSSLCFH